MAWPIAICVATTNKRRYFAAKQTRGFWPRVCFKSRKARITCNHRYTTDVELSALWIVFLSRTKGEMVDIVSTTTKEKWKVIAYGAMITAFLMSLLTTGHLGDKIASTQAIDHFARTIGSFVPAANAVAIQTTYPSIARLTIASQWLFFPIYLTCMIVTQQHWGALHWKEGISKAIRIKARIASIFLFIIFGAYIYGDFTNGPLSVLRGTPFSPDSTWFFTLPFAGRFGLAVSAFITPLLEATIYCVFLVFAVAFITWLAGLRGKQTKNHPNE
ncbi:hypothetical protein IHE49_04705 [Rhodanobacter sp. 7MK24]|uniref:hypothetical protein n=1 Tax=Rhodanobacter sp. 7MK24 TaxID=2775922 RepID=UPI00177C762A|nr:hypothetical protein [Rhodanobacter sp. 7MK24]MBD8879773.1 hypothetical protein [Rhodanobacter sp. 7MK24]